MEKSRAIKYCLPETVELKSFFNDYHDALCKLNNYIFDQLSTGKLEWKQIRVGKRRTADVLKADGISDTDIATELAKYTVENGFKLPKLVWEECQKIITPFNFLDKPTHWVKGMTTYVLDCYKGRLRRHKKVGLKKIVFNKNKAIRIPRNILEDNNLKDMFGTLTLYGWKTAEGISIPYPKVYSSISNKKQLTTRDGGGNLKYYLNKGKFVFIARAKMEYNCVYKPIGALGFDVNDSDDSFLVFNDGFPTIIQPARKIINQIDVCTVGRNNKLLKSSQRRHFNNKAKKLHNKLKNAYRPIIDSIITYVTQNKLLLCIDNVHVGNGTFGSGQIINLLIAACENKGIPFILVPTQNTSRTCHECQNIDKDARVSTDIYRCSNAKCKLFHQQQNAHKNAAIVISQKGWSSYISGP